MTVSLTALDQTTTALLWMTTQREDPFRDFDVVTSFSFVRVFYFLAQC